MFNGVNHSIQSEKLEEWNAEDIDSSKEKDVKWIQNSILRSLCQHRRGSPTFTEQSRSIKEKED